MKLKTFFFYRKRNFLNLLVSYIYKKKLKNVCAFMPDGSICLTNTAYPAYRLRLFKRCYCRWTGYLASAPDDDDEMLPKNPIISAYIPAYVVIHAHHWMSVVVSIRRRKRGCCLNFGRVPQCIYIHMMWCTIWRLNRKTLVQRWWDLFLFNSWKIQNPVCLVSGTYPSSFMLLKRMLSVLGT